MARPELPASLRTGLCLAVLLAGCGRPAPRRAVRSPSTGVTAPTSAGLPTPVDRETRFRELAEAAGFVVQQGSYEAFDEEACCNQEDAHCLGNNPTTPYGLYGLPNAPGQTGSTMYRQPDGTSRAFRLREDEVLVLMGRTPPEARYASWRSMVGYRMVTAANLPILVTGSLGASLNHLVLAERFGADDVWDRPFAILTTTDAATEREVVDLLVQAGFPEEEVFFDRIAPELAVFGLDESGDLFIVGNRTAVIEDPQAAAAHYADLGARVYRLTPVDPRPIAEPHPVPDLPPRGSGTDESYLQGALDALDAAIRDRYAGENIVAAEMTEFWRPLFDCLRTQCGGAIHDRFVGTVPPFLLDDEHVVVVFGVNHERTGKGAYSNFTVDDQVRHMGIVSVDSRDMVGSARAFLPDHPQVDDLYAWVVARDCASRPEPHCAEIPYQCPGVEAGDPAHITFRVYLEESTGAAPLMEEMLADRVFLVGP